MINTIRTETFKKRHHYPSLEDIAVNKHYAFSISPKFQDHKSFTCTYLDHQKLLAEYILPYACFVLRPEISTENNNLHYHGTIKFKSSKALSSFYYHKIQLLKELCTFTIEPIIDYEWKLYCIKTRHLLKPYLQSINLSYKLTNTNITLNAL